MCNYTLKSGKQCSVSPSADICHIHKKILDRAIYADQEYQIRMLKDQLEMYKEQYTNMIKIERFNKIYTELGNYMDLKYMRDNRDWTDMKIYFNSKENEDTLCKIFGNKVDFEIEFHRMRFERNKLAHRCLTLM
jgi:hypothetical protein